MRPIARVAPGALGFALFWIGLAVADAQVVGYSARADYISSLASRGSPVAALGVSALLCSAAAHGWVAWVVSRAGAARLRLGGLALGGTALAVVVIAAFRQSCPAGPAGCSGPDAGAPDWVDAAHGAGVVGYEVCFVAATVLVAAGVWRSSRGLALGTLAVGAVSVALLLRSASTPDPGLWQRLWVAVDQAWLLAAALGCSRVRGSGVAGGQESRRT